MQSIKIVFYSCALLLFALQVACQKEQTIAPTKLLSGETFYENLRIDGHEFDSLLIENCVFDGSTLNIGNVDFVVIRNCVFKDIDKNGLKIGFIGPSQAIRIENCSFENIGYNGIDSHERASNCVITGCSFNNVALSQVGAAMAQAHHGIYWKGKNVLIEKNRMIAGDQPFGNGISVRSSGIVRQNVISGYPKNGVMYFSNHPGGDSLLIENNFLVNNEFSITLGTEGDLSQHNENVIIRFNSMTQKENYSMYVASDFESTTNIEIYGNITVNPTEEYIRSFYDIIAISYNLTTPNDIGFINMEDGDLHLTESSEAIGFATNALYFPLLDIDGDLRNPASLNAGADE